MASSGFQSNRQITGAIYRYRRPPSITYRRLPIPMGVPVMQRTHGSGSSTLLDVLEIARNPGKQWALITVSQGGMRVNDDRGANAIQRQELRADGLDYWLIFGEWRETPDEPTGEWRRFAFFDGTGRNDFNEIVGAILRRHRQPAALVGNDGDAAVIHRSGEVVDLGTFDPVPSVAAYGKALGGAGTLSIVRAFVPVGVFVHATAEHEAERPDSQ
jgi:hypothetical protein